MGMILKRELRSGKWEAALCFVFTWLKIGPSIVGWNTVVNELLYFIEAGRGSCFPD